MAEPIKPLDGQCMVAKLKNRRVMVCALNNGEYFIGFRKLVGPRDIAQLRFSLSGEAFNAEFGADKTEGQIRGFTRNHRLRSGRTGRYERGDKPWNTGTKGVSKPNSGTFRKGNVPGNTRPMYSERINKDGFVEIKVPLANPYTGAETRFMHKHVWVWEQANGPVPPDHVIRFLDGDKTNCALENLGLFTRAESLEMTRLGYGEAHADVKPSIALLARLKTAAHKAKRETAPCRSS